MSDELYAIMLLLRAQITGLAQDKAEALNFAKIVIEGKKPEVTPPESP